MSVPSVQMLELAHACAPIDMLPPPRGRTGSRRAGQTAAQGTAHTGFAYWCQPMLVLVPAGVHLTTQPPRALPTSALHTGRGPGSG